MAIEGCRVSPIRVSQVARPELPLTALRGPLVQKAVVPELAEKFKRGVDLGGTLLH